jgi:hypothetical protein
MLIKHRITINRMSGDPPDIELAPKLLHTDTFDFDKAEKIIKVCNIFT